MGTPGSKFYTLGIGSIFRKAYVVQGHRSCLSLKQMAEKHDGVTIPYICSTGSGPRLFKTNNISR